MSVEQTLPWDFKKAKKTHKRHLGKVGYFDQEEKREGGLQGEISGRLVL